MAPAQIIDPQTQQKPDELHIETLTRAYVNRKGYSANTPLSANQSP